MVAICDFAAMLAAGFLDEVRTLRALPELRVHPRPLDLPAWLEGPLLVLATLLLCLAGYELVRRLGWVRPLFGLKRTAAPSPARDGREREAVG